MENINKPKIICLTPVKNEAWILDKFLKSASLWADYIIISDQGSTDGSLEIAKRFPKVTLLENESLANFNEYLMRKPLFDEARKIDGNKILISLDADEFFTPNCQETIEWETLLSAKSGTMLKFPWINICPNFESYWLATSSGNFGYIDDGIEFTTGIIHTPRSLQPIDHDAIGFNQIKVLHFQYVDWERMKSKQRWYQCFELINKVNNPVDIFRGYHHMDAMPEADKKPIPREWIHNYNDKGIDITSVYKQSLLYWEKQVLDYMSQYGIRYFSHLNIWEVSWVGIAKKWDYPNPESYKDPRNKLEKLANRWLIKTQTKKNKFGVIQCDKILKLFYK
ncbi:MAG: glycosyltransferase family 2 protein [Candidatus Symbiothrix sp.]|jgi:glycosyltransferase involved in cell wall biosynthesis|nr:glycosyltransferase family 2 protein [Candidatus Symbiothrix sp.]